MLRDLCRRFACPLSLAAWLGFVCALDAAAEVRDGVASTSRRALPMTCRFGRLATGVVTRVVSSTTLRLDDGALIKLQSVLPPQATDVPGARGDWPIEQQVRLELEARIQGHNIRYAARRGRRDRYGRRLAHVWIELGAAGSIGIETPSQSSIWIQRWMLQQGLARFAPDRERTACADLLVRAEAEAQQARRGLWQLNAYRIRDAGELRELARLRNTYQIVEGRILNAGTSRGGRHYLNFGRNWRRDFTGGISRGQMRYFARTDVSPSELAGARVRIRGWIEFRGGPYIEIKHTHQLEVLTPEHRRSDLR